MKIRDHCLYLKTIGGQLTFAILMFILCSIGFFIIDAFEKAGYLNLLLAILKGVFAAGGVYLLFYSVFISKDLTEQHYKKKR